MPTDLLVAETDRRKWLGSSDIAAVLGLSDWATPVTVWREKTGIATDPIDPEKQKLFRRGKLMEPVIFQMLEEDRGIQALRRGCRYRDPEYDWMAAEIDGEALIDGEWVNLEAKSQHNFVAYKWGEADTDSVPVYFYAQAMYAMMITGRNRCIFAVLFGLDNLVTYEIYRDDETIAGMRAKAIDFWNNHVLAQIPPDPITLEDVYRLLRRDANTVIEADKATAANIAALKLARDEAKAAKAKADDLCFQIGRAVLGAEAMSFPSKKPKQVIVVNGQPALSISFQHQDRIDSDMVRARHPAVAAECAQPVEFFRFDLPKGRKA